MPSPLALVLFGLVLSVAYSNPNLSKRVLRGNDISYGVYLYHALFINIYLEGTERGVHEMSALQGAVSIFTATLLFAVVSWLFVERPALNIKSRYGSIVKNLN